MNNLIDKINALNKYQKTQNNWTWKTNRDGTKYCCYEPTSYSMVNLEDVIKLLQESINTGC